MFYLSQDIMSYHLVMYGLGLDSESMMTCSQKLRNLVSNHRCFSGQVVTFRSDFSTSAARVYRDITEVNGPKIAIVLYRHDGINDVGRLQSFLLHLTDLCSQEENTILCVCFPIPNQATFDHFEQCERQALALVDLEQHTGGELNVLELFNALRQYPNFTLQIPGVTSFNPHRITSNGCQRIALSLFLQLARIVQLA
jgi:hypothetical protein